jgi:phospholipid/cholesterol/gamma-HCH transport system substrate-binding protein
MLIGAFTLLAGALLIGGLLQANAVREWLHPGQQLLLVLPDAGLFGLSKNAKIEVLGTPAGRIDEIVIDPNEEIHARATIDADMAPFVRKDSSAIIRKTFGVAGDSYLDITRGRGEPMDWEYAVLEATPDRAPTDSIGEMLEDIRARVMPILEQTERAMTALADLSESLAAPDGHIQTTLNDVSALTGRIERGEGSLGRLLSNDKTAREFENLLGNANQTVAGFEPVLSELQATMQQVTGITAAINAQSDDLPEINERIVSILASVDQLMHDLQATSPQLPKITRDISATTASVPVVMGMVQQTLAELETLLRQLRSSWLLGGGAELAPGGGRLPAQDIRP